MRCAHPDALRGDSCDDRPASLPSRLPAARLPGPGRPARLRPAAALRPAASVRSARPRPRRRVTAAPSGRPPAGLRQPAGSRGRPAVRPAGGARLLDGPEEADDGGLRHRRRHRALPDPRRVPLVSASGTSFFGIGCSLSGFSFAAWSASPSCCSCWRRRGRVLPAFYDLKLGFPRSWVTVGLAGLGFLLTLFAWIDTFSVGFSIWALLALLMATRDRAVRRPQPAARAAQRARPCPAAWPTPPQWANQPAPDLGVPRLQGSPAPPTASPPTRPVTPHPPRRRRRLRLRSTAAARRRRRPRRPTAPAGGHPRRVARGIRCGSLLPEPPPRRLSCRADGAGVPRLRRPFSAAARRVRRRIRAGSLARVDAWSPCSHACPGEGGTTSRSCAAAAALARRWPPPPPSRSPASTGLALAVVVVQTLDPSGGLPVAGSLALAGRLWLLAQGGRLDLGLGAARAGAAAAHPRRIAWGLSRAGRMLVGR